jgi:hypothetical protein
MAGGLMKSKMKALFTLIIFLAQMYPVEHSHAEPLPITTSSAQKSYPAVSLPQKDRLTLVSVVQVTAGREILGAIAAYDDAETARPADFLELYNNAGALLAVSWFDRFGIERLAIDRALVEDTNKLEGVFVLVITEDSI